MDLYGNHSQSLLQKVIIHLLEILTLCLSYWILFSNGGAWVNRVIHVANSTLFLDRRVIIYTFSVITFLRIAFAMFVLVKRTIPWEECFGVPMDFATYYVGFALFVLPTSIPIHLVDGIGMVLFLSGSVLNTVSEVQRHIWKKNQSAKGGLYTGGLFAYSRHINYFGDILWVSAFAILTGNWYAASIPLLLFGFFAFFNAPKLDAYLAQKYGEEFKRYAARTPMLIQFLY